MAVFMLVILPNMAARPKGDGILQLLVPPHLSATAKLGQSSLAVPAETAASCSHETEIQKNGTSADRN
jgi:hypothetical protein